MDFKKFLNVTGEQIENATLLSISNKEEIDAMKANKVYLTQEAYEQLEAAGQLNPNVEYNVFE